MAKEPAGTPKFTKGQIVMIALLNEARQPINELAKKCAQCFAKPGVIVSWGSYSLNRVARLVHQVKMDDGKVLLLTEDCLMPVKGSV